MQLQHVWHVPHELKHLVILHVWCLGHLQSHNLIDHVRCWRSGWSDLFLSDVQIGAEDDPETSLKPVVTQVNEQMTVWDFFNGIIRVESTDLRNMTLRLQSKIAPSLLRLRIPGSSGTPGASSVKAPAKIWWVPMVWGIKTKLADVWVWHFQN